MDEYEIGDLIEATVILGGRERHELLAYQPDPGPDEDLFPWQRIERGEQDEFTSYFSAEELANVKRLVTIPAVTREQVIEALTDQPDILASDAAADAVLTLFGQRG